MSLDVYLTVTREVPAREVPARTEETEVFDRNITHNLGKMAAEAGIYKHLWRPEELGIKTAGELVEPLATGLETMGQDRERFEAFSPSNGWGDYDGLLEFLREYLDACRDNPDAIVGVSR